MRPIAHVRPELAKAAGAGGEETAVGDRAGGDDVAQLAGALRAAERAYRGYLAELCQADVEPVEDWPTWYAEYLLESGVGRRRDPSALRTSSWVEAQGPKDTGSGIFAWISDPLGVIAPAHLHDSCSCT
jgi:hypothetical protein